LAATTTLACTTVTPPEQVGPFFVVSGSIDNAMSSTLPADRSARGIHERAALDRHRTANGVSMRGSPAVTAAAPGQVEPDPFADCQSRLTRV